MRYEEIKVENINDAETMECIEIFDEELRSALNKIPDLSDILIEKYYITTDGENQVNAEILMKISKQALMATVPFPKDFFDDYCYSTRKERDTLLKNIVDQIKNQLR